MFYIIMNKNVLSIFMKSAFVVTKKCRVIQHAMS